MLIIYSAALSYSLNESYILLAYAWNETLTSPTVHENVRQNTAQHRMACYNFVSLMHRVFLRTHSFSVKRVPGEIKRKSFAQ